MDLFTASDIINYDLSIAKLHGFGKNALDFVYSYLNNRKQGVKIIDRNSTTVVAKLLHFKDKQDILHEAKSPKIRTFCFKDFSREILEIRKGLWNEVVSLREEEGKFVVINYSHYSPKTLRI